MVAQTVVASLQFPHTLLLQEVRYDDRPSAVLLHSLRSDGCPLHCSAPLGRKGMVRLAVCLQASQLA